MEEKENIESNNSKLDEEHSEKKETKSFFGKFGDALKKGAKFVGDNINKGVENVRNSINEHQKQKEIEAKLKEKFNIGTVKLILIIPEKKNKAVSVNSRIDYDKKTISLYGENSDLKPSCFFVDKLNQKYVISVIRLSQKIELEVDSIVYKRSITVVEFVLCNDYETKNQMQTIINNQISIENSVINKSDIG